ncbi:anaerobic ribonucleoside-triphosphate reductase activating protein [Candidatus Woesearchaeota archaeon]|nr:anaerobic ribonucleoside-triphosphate reductase activating protein [Candidatus Woesearchaeota archaeon]
MSLKIKGLQKTSLIDYPPYTCCVVFLSGCNFRCGFCHNPALLVEVAKTPTIHEAEFFGFLEKRKRWLDAVCITGGEPCLYDELPDFIRKIKRLGYKVKLDTNGSNPDMLEGLIRSGLVDYIAMDIKGSLDEYDEIAGVAVDKEAIKRSVSLIMDGMADYEFRTTVLPRFHKEKDIIRIGEWLKGSKRFVIQQFRNDREMLDSGFKEEVPYSLKELKRFREILAGFIDDVEIRNI